VLHSSEQTVGVSGVNSGILWTMQHVR